MEQQQTDEKFMRLALNEAEKSVRRAGSTHRCRGGRGRTYRRSGAQPGRNLGGRYGSCGNAGPDSRSLDRRRQILVRMYVVCDGRALHHVCGGDCVEPGRAGGLWRRRSEAWLSPLFGAGVSAPNDGDAGGIGRGVREARPFVLRCVEKVIFGKCRKKLNLHSLLSGGSFDGWLRPTGRGDISDGFAGNGDKNGRNQF